MEESHENAVLFLCLLEMINY